MGTYKRSSKLRFGVTIFAALVLGPVLSGAPAHAAPSLVQVQAQVRALQEDAAAAAENAQQAQVEFNKLNKQLASVQQQATRNIRSCNYCHVGHGHYAGRKHPQSGPQLTTTETGIEFFAGRS